ncbi:MAG TPA: DUF445 domain-containing protein [Clostridia bacterium]|nr:DUF445 domain-containing protein [Clostridia bacterium]
MEQVRQPNKTRANILLIIFFLLFIAATFIEHLYSSSFAAGLLAFTAEAALVGGIADWFAVTALFRKPLGISWHTAIIPNNRERIVESVSNLVSGELLSVDALKVKLEALNLVDTIVDGLLEKLDKIISEENFQDMIGSKAESLDKSKIAAYLDNFIKEGLKKEELSDDIRSLLVKAFEEGKHKEWLSGLVGKAVEIAKKDSTREKIYRLLREQERYNESSTRAGSFFVKMILNMSRNSKYSNLFSITDMLQRELVSTLEAVKDPSNPVFTKLTECSEDLLKHLDEDHTLLELLQTWKNGILEHLGLLEALQQLLTSAIESGFRKQEAAHWLSSSIDNYRNRLQNDEAIRSATEDMLGTVLQRVIINEHHLIGEIAKDTLGSFSNEKLNRFFDEKVGNDLQWIRINGSIVGAGAGIIIYLFVNLLYNPYILPFISRFIG